MFVSVVEQSQNFGSDARGRRTGSRTFRVSGVAPSSLVENPSIHGLPAPGTQWENMTADSIVVSTSPTPTTAYDATVNYSDNGQFRFPENRDETDSGYQSWSGGTADETTNLPYYSRVQVTIPFVGPSDQWVLREQPILEQRERFTRRVVVDAADLQAALNGLRSQANTVHTIYGRTYLFTGGTYMERDGGAFEFDYNWESDPGTPFDFDTASNPDVAMPGPFSVDGSQWNPALGAAYFRPPYSFVVPAERSSLAFMAIIRYAVVPGGYTQLVGAGIPPP